MSVPDQSDGDNAQVSSYRVPKIPPFWRNDPETWFVQVEATFRIANCKTDRTKADYLISALESEVVQHVRDIVNADPPPENLYQVLKNRILSAFSTSPEARLRQLLKGQSLGDRKPSHLLNHMRQLNGGQCSSAVLKSLFLEQLPEPQRAILVAMNEPDLQKIADIADKIVDMSNLDMAIAPIRSLPGTTKARPHHDTNDPSSTEKQLAEIIKRLDSLDSKLEKFKRDRPRPRSNSTQRDQHSSDVKPGLCFIHQKYGRNATSCRKPCSWVSEETSEN